MKDLLDKIIKLCPEDDREEYAYLYAQIKLHLVTSPNALEELGFCESILSNRFFPKNEASEVFCTVRNFKAKERAGFFHPSELEKYSRYVFRDCVSKAMYFRNTERPIDVIIKPEDNEYSTIASSSREGQNIFTTPITRNGKAFTLFQTYFVEHSNANKKEFAIPNGEAFGIEIEMKFPDVFSKLRFSNFVGTNFPKWITERDGSLEDKGNAKEGGLELVSPPLSFDNLLNQLKPILANAVAQKGVGHQAGVFYGIHINVNIYGENKSRTAKRFISIINDPNLRYFWETMSRRRGSASMQEYCPFQNIDYKNCLGSESENHYRSVYYRVNRDRVATNCAEVRIFRSNLKFVSVKISVEICKLALDFSMGESNLNDYETFQEHVMKNASEDLKKYIYASGAIDFLNRAATITKKSQYNVNLAEFEG